MSLTRFQSTVVDTLQGLIEEGLVEVVRDEDQAPPADDRDWDSIPVEDYPSDEDVQPVQMTDAEAIRHFVNGSAVSA